MMGPWYPGHMGFGGGSWIAMGFMIVFWIAVIIGIIFLVRYLVTRPGADQQRGQVTGPSSWDRQETSQTGSALRILEERYARGEIDQEEFLRKKADLTRTT